MADKKIGAKSKVEAILFSVGHRISLDELSKLARVLKQDALVALRELQKEYDEKQSSLMLVEDGEHWKFTVRDHLISVVRKIVTETELTKSVLETLAVIAFKYPILQSDLIKIRTNKAYDHLLELEKSGYISRQKHGRTNLIKLTEKFFRYFDLTEDKLREQFKDFASIAQAIKDKEIEVDKIKEDQKKMARELGEQDAKIKKEIESLDEAGEEFSIPVETYDASKESKDANSEQNPEEKLGGLEVIETQPVKEKKHHEENQKFQQQEESKSLNENTNQSEENKNISNPKQAHPKKHHGIKLTPEQEKIAEKKADDIIEGK